MPELSHDPADYDTPDGYAHAQACNAKDSGDAEIFAIGSGEIEARTSAEYAVEPAPGWCAMGVTNELAGAIEDITGYRDGSRLITRSVTVGPWRYVTPEEIENA